MTTTQRAQDYCGDCGQVEWLCICEPEQLSWGELAQLTHKTQVEKFNWCGCEEQEQFPYDDCPRPAMCGDHLVPIDQCNCKP